MARLEEVLCTAPSLSGARRSRESTSIDREDRRLSPTNDISEKKRLPRIIRTLFLHPWAISEVSEPVDELRICWDSQRFVSPNVKRRALSSTINTPISDCSVDEAKIGGREKETEEGRNDELMGSSN